MAPISEFLIFTGIGALAQLVDGALGMAYGVTSAGLLLGLGMQPALASASVHYAETFTCGASGLSHWWAGNVQRRLFLVLVIPGVIGAIIGATVLAPITAVVPGAGHSRRNRRDHRRDRAGADYGGCSWCWSFPA